MNILPLNAQTVYLNHLRYSCKIKILGHRSFRIDDNHLDYCLICLHVSHDILLQYWLSYYLIGFVTFLSSANFIRFSGVTLIIIIINNNNYIFTKLLD